MISILIFFEASELSGGPKELTAETSVVQSLQLHSLPENELELGFWRLTEVIQPKGSRLYLLSLSQNTPARVAVEYDKVTVNGVPVSVEDITDGPRVLNPGDTVQAGARIPKKEGIAEELHTFIIPTADELAVAVGVQN